MFNILVLGGSGFVGRSLCEKLVERAQGSAGPPPVSVTPTEGGLGAARPWEHAYSAGGRIVVPSRRPHRAAAIRSLPTVELVAADMNDDAALAAALEGCDAVVNLVAILHGSEAEFERAHVALPRRLAAACAAAGIRRLVHVSSLGAGDGAPSNYLRSKTAGEAVLRASGLDVTLLRPSVVFGEHDRFINLFARLQSVFPVMPLAGSGARLQPVWVDDVAAAIVACLDDPTTTGQTIECAGPQVFTLKELVQLAGRWAGHERPVLPLPMFLGRLQALAMECLPGEPLMSRDNLASMQVPNIASGKLPDLARLGINACAIEQVMPEVLSRRAGPARLDPWRMRAGRG